MNETFDLVGKIGSMALIRRDDQDIDYKIHPDFRWQGYGREMVGALLDACFRRLGIPLIVAAIFPQNEASLRLVGSLGFTREGLRRMSCDHERFGPMDEVIFSLTSGEWHKEASL